jgi:hypothetical protein
MWETTSVDPPSLALPHRGGGMRRCALVSTWPWANRMPQRSQGPGTACRRGMALVTGAGMRYDAAACSAIFQPLSAASATHDPLAKPHPGGAHGSRPSVVPA